MHQHQEEPMVEISSKLIGVILRKAEFENNFDAVYSKVFERMFQMQMTGGDEVLFVLGDIGG